MEEDKLKYNIYEIVYTDVDNKRVKAEVSEETSSKALCRLEEELLEEGYLKNDIDKMLPVGKVTEYKSSEPWVDFR
jgi:hypothetical protein